MATFIRVTDNGGTQVRVNIDNIQSYEPSGDSVYNSIEGKEIEGAVIEMTDSSKIYVKESAEQIDQKIANAGVKLDY